MTNVADERRKWWVLAAMGASLGIFLLDETVVGVALPTIQRDLSLSDTDGHWVVNIYLLMLAALSAASGRLCDIFGFKRLYLFGVCLFGIASIACGLANDLATLLTARVLQGVGAAVIFPASVAMIAVIFAEEERGKALGIYGATGTIFLASGPFVGGLFTEFISWRWIFWINPFVVVAAIAIILTCWSDPPRQPSRGRFDFTGLVLLIGGIGLVIVAVMEAPDWGWDQPLVWILLAVGALLLALFVRTELTARSPLVEVDLFANGAFTACSMMVFTGQFTKIAVLIILSVYFQTELGMSPLMAGIALLAGVAPQPVVAVFSGRITDAMGTRRPALFGLGSTVLIFLWLAVAVHWKSYWMAFPALLAWGVAVAFLFVPGMRGSANSVPLEKQGQVGGIMLTAQLVGGTIGMTLSSTLLASTGGYQLPFLATAMLAVFVLWLTWRYVAEEMPLTGQPHRP